MGDDDQQLVGEISTSIERRNEVDEMDEMDEWVMDIEGRVEDPDISRGPRQSMDSDCSDSEKEPSIFGKWECWDDFGASFIPERKKWQLIACMTHWFGLNVKSYLKYMQPKVDLAWSYYRGVDEQFRAKNSKNFIEHLLASSCFLIFAMFFLQYHEEYEKVVEDKMHDRNSFPKGLTRKDYGNVLTILQDRVKNQTYMLTLKYQIPWFVLEAVYTKLSNIGKVLDIPIHKLALPCFPSYVKVHPSKVDGVTVPEHGFKHLLHIFHWSRSSDGDSLGYSTKFFCHFHIPSATDLILSQTVFVNDEGGSIDVSYSDNKRLSGSVMKLTPFRLSQYFTKLYEDLLIFERTYIHCGMPFTIYVACLTCLVKTEADARVLRENGVIPSTSFDDNEVLRYVHELKTFIAENYVMPYELANLEEEVMAHYQRSAYKVYGEFKKRYCSNPWIIISVIAGILLFLLTFLQTLYGMLGYYNH